MAAWAALTLNFFIPRLMPGDPAAIIFARFRGKLKPEAINALRETFGLTDEPLLGQYWSYLKSMLMGDLGISIAYFPVAAGSPGPLDKKTPLGLRAKILSADVLQ